MGFMVFSRLSSRRTTDADTAAPFTASIFPFASAATRRA
jgi:hypothetical protein